MVNFTNRNAIFQIYVAQKYLEVPQCHQNMVFAWFEDYYFYGRKKCKGKKMD